MPEQELSRSGPQAVAMFPIPSPTLLVVLVMAAGLAALGPWSPACLTASGGLCVLLLLGVIGEGVLTPRCIDVEARVPAVLALGESGELRWRLHNQHGRLWRVSLAGACPRALGPAASPLSVWLPPAGRKELCSPISAGERGTHQLGGAELRMRRRFGLLEYRFGLAGRQEVRVCPRVPGLVRVQHAPGLRAALPAQRKAGSWPARQGEFERLKDHVVGDDIRQIDWKATARLGRPIARVYGDERAQDLVLALDTTRGMAGRQGPRTKLDGVIEAALGLASVALAGGDRVGLVVFDRAVRVVLPPRADRGQLGRLIDRLTDPRASLTSANYRAAVHSLGAHQRRRALIVWLTDIVDEAQGARLVKAVHSLRGRHLNLVASPAEEPLAAPSAARASRTTEFFASVAAIETAGARQRLDHELRLGGAHVLNNPLSGLPGALVQRYYQVKRSGLL